MKKLFLPFLVLISLLYACDDDENNTPVINLGDAYIINYGSYGSADGSVSAYYESGDSIVNNVFENVNSNALGGNIQYASIFSDDIYFMSNSTDEVAYVDATTLDRTNNGISESITKPRFCVANDTCLFVSCWGGDVWNDFSISYIAVIDIETKSLIKTISVEGGPEGLALANDKLYCALNYEAKITVIDLKDDYSQSSIDLPAVSSYILKDSNDNLYVTLISSYYATVTKTGIGYINTSTDVLEASYELNNVSTNYSSILSANSDLSTIYILAGSYDANYNYTGAIYTFNTESNEFNSTPILSDISGLNGVCVNPDNDYLYVLISESTTAAGKLKIYDTDMNLVSTKTTGIAPAWTIFK